MEPVDSIEEQSSMVLTAMVVEQRDTLTAKDGGVDVMHPRAMMSRNWSDSPKVQSLALASNEQCTLSMHVIMKMWMTDLDFGRKESLRCTG